MSEWLTTGEMIDRLKVGEVAKSVEVPFGKALLGEEVEYTNSKLTYKGCLIDFQINDFTQKMKWRILPKYVTLEEAMKAVKEGKKVKIHYPNGEHDFIFNKDDSVILEHTNWGELLESKFSIIE